MNFLHYPIDVNAGDTIEVTLDRAANVQLLTPDQFDAYQNHRPYRYYGGYITQSPYQIEAPHTGRWHLVMDLGGAAGSVRASAQVIPAKTGAVA